jgi:hypothetical protein
MSGDPLLVTLRIVSHPGRLSKYDLELVASKDVLPPTDHYSQRLLLLPVAGNLDWIK